MPVFLYLEYVLDHSNHFLNRCSMHYLSALSVIGMQALQQGIDPLAHRKIGEEYLLILTHLMKDTQPSFIW